MTLFYKLNIYVLKCGAVRYARMNSRMMFVQTLIPSTVLMPMYSVFEPVLLIALEVDQLL